VRAAKSALTGKAEHVGYEYQRARGNDETTARALAHGVARNAARLPLSHMLKFKGGVVVSVGEALLDPDRYVGRDCLDPIEPIERDYCARFLRGRRDYVCFIKSFAHGGSVYQLEYDLAAASVALKTCPEEMQATMYGSIVNKFSFVMRSEHG
jgi:hypothetical protein